MNSNQYQYRYSIYVYLFHQLLLPTLHTTLLIYVFKLILHDNLTFNNFDMCVSIGTYMFYIVCIFVYVYLDTSKV